ncbi:MAG: DUF1491 family protein [Alphaproteobacteria bacterium]|nr:DUF1491 family protein [Alphaproteobacteria bacterium]
MEPKLTADFRVKALIRRVQQVGAIAMVVHRGDATAGSVLVKHNRFAAGCRVLSQTRDPAGALAWFAATGTATVDEAAADAYIERQLRFDRDLWVIEVEDPRGTWSPDEAMV